MLTAGMVVSLLAISAEAQDTAGAPCDRSAIRWFVPGEFEAARRKAEEEGRFLLLKGISFGIDDLGATSATKGRW